MESEYLNFCTHYRDLALRLHTSRVNSSCKIRLKKKLKKKEKFTYLNYIYRKVFDIFLKFFAKQKIKKPFLFGFLWKLKKKKCWIEKLTNFQEKKKNSFCCVWRRKKLSHCGKIEAVREGKFSKNVIVCECCICRDKYMC